jgi:ABC-2 type transport system permease protein
VTAHVSGASAERDVTRPVGFLRAARGVFDLSLEGMLWSRRSLVVAVLLALPVVFALLYRGVLIARIPPRVTGFQLYGVVVAFYYVRNVLPLAALFYATSLIADEVEGRTITYLLSRPVLRVSIFAGKFAAYVAATLTLALPTCVVTFLLLVTARGWSGVGDGLPDLARDLGVIALALAAYGALFALLGVLLRKPMIPGLLFLFVWELLANLPGYLPRFTVTVYLRSLIRHRPPAEGFGEMFAQVLPAPLCLGVLAGMIAAFLALGAWIFSTREYVLEQ